LVLLVRVHRILQSVVFSIQRFHISSPYISFCFCFFFFFLSLPLSLSLSLSIHTYIHRIDIMHIYTCRLDLLILNKSRSSAEGFIPHGDDLASICNRCTPPGSRDTCRTDRTLLPPPVPLVTDKLTNSPFPLSLPRFPPDVGLKIGIIDGSIDLTGIFLTG